MFALFVVHILGWFFFLWFFRFFAGLLNRKFAGGLMWQALIMGFLSYILHYCLHIVAKVPLLL
jgi:hypothetical protein